MGHCEMSLAVAGLTDGEVDDKTRQLAGDWSDLPAEERLALEFIRNQAEAPPRSHKVDIERLESVLGRERAWQVIWWGARCHYMTKVADAFQLPLETDNPFTAMPGAKKG